MNASSSCNRIGFGEFVLDIRRRVLYRDGQRVSLTGKPLDLLIFLVQNPGRTVDDDELLHVVWGGQRGEASIHKAVQKVREALRDTGPPWQFIETVYGEGYSFVADIRALEPYGIGSTTPLGASQDATVDKGTRLRWMLATLSVVTLLLLAGGLVLYQLAQPGLPARISYAGNKLSAWDIKDRLVWEYEPPYPVYEPFVTELAEPVRFADLHGDGQTEILVVVDLTPKDGHLPRAFELYCFSAQGKLLWQYKPDLVLTAAGRKYEGPWHFKQVLLADQGKGKEVWLAVNHHIWWPSFVVKLDAAGRSTVQMTHSGCIYVLQGMTTRAGSFILAGGVNNEYDAASLAILRQDGPPVASPQRSGSRFKCSDCPAQTPDRYFLFPPSELHALESLDPYNKTMGIKTFGRRAEVWVAELPPSVNAIYELSDNFEVQVLYPSAGYRQLHARLEREGKLTHTGEQCPEQNTPKRVRSFHPEEGWVELAVRAAPFKH